ncbi:MAG: aconitase family protein [Myxococcota bacterium]|nr:aconitase family protein [Myxococcota bacterium]
MKLTGKVLWLTDDPSQIEKQLQGDQLSITSKAIPELHYGVNTDAMISGAACTLGYTPDILGPYFLENFKETIRKSSVRDGGFQVIVGGDAYGSGSSREAAVVAHIGGGIELVVAKSFQRIFQENMVYSGLPFTSDFGVLERLLVGIDVELSELYSSLPPFFRAVATTGGLLAYGTALLNGDVSPVYEISAPQRPMNCVEKIIAQNVWCGNEKPRGLNSVKPGEQVLCDTGFRGVHEYTAGMVIDLYQQEWGDQPVHNPDLVAAFEDHFVLIDSDTVPLTVKNQRLKPARKLRDEMVEACKKNNIRLHGPGREHQAGVCHRIVVEEYALPGMIIVLTDSHTPTSGVMNSFAFGVGSTAMSFALRTGLIPVTVPKTVRVEVTGDSAGVISPKDLILHLIGDPYFREEHWRESPTDTCIVEFGGAALEQWDVDELSVLTNMTVEGGLMTGIVEPCKPVRDFLKARRGMSTEDIDKLFVSPDENAEYAKVIKIDLADVPLTVATPGDSRNRAPLSEHNEVPIHNVVIASCTGGSLADLRAAADVLEGRGLNENVRVTVTPSSATVAEAAEKEGLLDTFRNIGAVITEPGCGSCIGNGPGIPFEGEVTASTTNRNFDRRMGAPGPVYLVSPAVAAASAVTGKLTDPRTLDK